MEVSKERRERKSEREREGGRERERERERERGGGIHHVPLYYFRQAVGATVTVWNDVTQEVWLFMEEISSDGDVSTVSEWSMGMRLVDDFNSHAMLQVDVVFPASPLFLWWDYKSIQLLLKPILEYAINNTDQYGLSIPYDLPWAPHHLGHWPGMYTVVFRGD